jgi:serine/threonine protein kinase
MAVKKIRVDALLIAEKVPDAEAEVRALQQEIDVLRSLDHERIVKYRGMLVEEDSVLLFLEFLSGGSVREKLKLYGAFKPVLVRKYAKQILEGLRFLHDKQIIHRDVKGANVLTDDRGDAKLADFGAAHRLDNLLTTSHGMKSIKGSVFWMAPEVVTQKAGRTCDTWSSGCTIVEMMLARHPWPQLDDVPLARALERIANDPEAIPLIPADASPDLADMLRKMFEREVSKRPYPRDLLESHPYLQG